jgi:hypothetical protein
MRVLTRLTASVVLLVLIAGPCGAADLEKALQALRAVGPKGAGNEAASAAWQEVAQADVSQVPELLAALDGANPLAANGIRTAVDTVCERALRDEGTLPKEAFERFALETSKDPKARRLAYEWLLKVDPEAEERIVPQFLDDPSVELRRDAVALLIKQGDKAAKDDDKGKAVKLLTRAFDAARDRDQIDLLAKQLKELGHEVDLIRHDGMIVDWLVIGPFDNTDEAGYDTVYPPEKEIDTRAKYDGKHGEVGWGSYRSESRGGKIDLYKALAESLVDISEKLHEREVVGYAVAEFHSSRNQEAQIRSSSTNAIKIWLNGELVDEHNVYHAGSQFDQFEAAAELREGKNQILVKLCQNAQTQSWTEQFAFQLRVCDAIGGGIRSEQ